MPPFPPLRLLLSVVFTLVLLLPGAAQARTEKPLYNPALYQALRYRLVGPFRGGRSSAVTGVASKPFTFYMGTPGGLWKSTNAGETWHNISDGFFDVGSVGAVAVSRSDPNVVYAGTGQATIRGNVQLGRGVYKSTDAGATWKRIGLENMGQISHICIDPHNPDIVYVAAIGNPFTFGKDRGVYRSRNGGATWKKVLYLGEKTGIGDLVMDATNPRILYATGWTVQRKPWTIISGGGADGIYKTTDGGDTWTQLKKGLPAHVGKIGIAVSPADPQRLWALVEAVPAQAGLYRSDDGGASWKRLETNQKRRLYERSWYYMHIFADPADANTVYVLNVYTFKSIDGGHTFKEMKNIHHGDGHDMWINPDHPNIMIRGDDGGGEVSLDGGHTWSTENNQPTAEMYYVFVDNQFPYHLYGPQQDNTTIGLPSRFRGGLTPSGYWQAVAGGESGFVAFDPDHPKIFYGSGIGGEADRLNTETGASQSIMAYPQMEFGMAPKELRYRFNWNAPMRVSPQDPNIVYYAAQKVLRSTDGGRSWKVISPDLTTDNPKTEESSGEPYTFENDGVEIYNSILSMELSQHKKGVIWVGTEDGRVQLTRDDGGHWTDITPAGMPKGGSVNSIELSPHRAGRAFIAVKHYMSGDWAPYIFRTDDYGASWKRLTDGHNGIPADTPVLVVREDPQVEGLLYAGTEYGIYVSFDDGAHWQSLQLNLPIVPVNDLRVHDQDLVVATTGRSYWILDDVTPLHHVAEAARASRAYLYPPRNTWRLSNMDGQPGTETAAGQNPPNGAMIFYDLPQVPDGDVHLDILGPDGKVIRSFSSAGLVGPQPKHIYFAKRGQEVLTKKAGMNRFVWNLRYPPVNMPADIVVWGLTGGPRVAPGEYRARLRIGDWSQERAFRVLGDPRLKTTQADYDAQLKLSLKMRDSLQLIWNAVAAERSVQEQANDAIKRLKAAGVDVSTLNDADKALAARLDAVEKQLMQPKMSAKQDIENFPQKVDAQLAYVYWWVDQVDQRPTAGQYQRYDDLKARIDPIIGKLRQVLTTDLPPFDARLKAAGAGPIIVPAPFNKGS